MLYGQENQIAGSIMQHCNMLFPNMANSWVDSDTKTLKPQ